MLHLTLFAPIAALPALLLMERIERWAAGAESAFRPARVATMTDATVGDAGTRASSGHHRPTYVRRLQTHPGPDPRRPKPAP
jgi:hypothetical protein